MITVTFTANSLTALRKDIAEFLGEATIRVELADKITSGDGDGVYLTTASDDFVIDRLIEETLTQPGPLEPSPTQAPIPEETQTEQPTDSVPSASPETHTFTVEDVRRVTLRLAQAKGRDAVLAVIEPYNVPRATEVSKDLWPELIAKLEAATNG